MTGILIKKQMMEIFRTYFYDAKKNKRRSGLSTFMLIGMYALLMAGVLGGMFWFLADSICEPLAAAGAGWLYFLLLGMIAVALGAFGSVFNTYSSLYQARDNDLLLSLPIPVGKIMTARLTSVYLIGLMYSAVVMIPAAAVYLLKAASGFSEVFGTLLLVVLVSLIVLLLSCALGWVVAKLSQKLKNKSFVVVAASLLFIAAYYYLYFRAQTMIQKLISDAALYGNKIKGSAYPLYLFGRIGQGDWVAIAIYTGVTALLLLGLYRVMSRSFLQIATATGSTSKAVYREKTLKIHRPGTALLHKEFGRFTGSPNYMLNCGLGTLMLLICGAFLLIKGEYLMEMAEEILPGGTSAALVLCSAVICLAASMNDMAEPSVSLEGKTLWVIQSLPVKPWQVLRAKLMVQLLLTGIPAILCIICMAVVVPAGIPELLLAAAVILCYVVMSALLGLSIGLKTPNLVWTNEIAPIKQSIGAMLALLTGFLYGAVLGGIYFLWGERMGCPAYLLTALLVTLALTALLYLWLRKRGTAILEKL